jgi:hypothetical protein
MPSTYSPDLRIELIATGEKSGTWGTITNTNLSNVLEAAIAGLADVIITNTDQALTVVDGNTDQSRCAAIKLSTVLTNNFNVYVPPVTKLYVIQNTSTTYSATIKCSITAGSTTPAPGGVGVTIPPAKSVLVRTDGTNVIEQLNYVAGNLNVGGNLTVDGNIASSSGAIPVSNGGTGVATISGVVFGNGTSPFTAATGTEISTAIGTTPVQKANAISNSGGWNITPSGTTLYFNYNGTNVGKLDSSGNFTVLGNVTAFAASI